MKLSPIIFAVLIAVVLLLGCIGGGDETYECGNAICETGETQDSCCSDCGCPDGEECTSSGCVPTATPPECGNDVCESGETQTNCCDDCGCPSGQVCENNECWIPIGCGDGTCDLGETQTNCCDDCGCPSGYNCVNNACIEEQQQYVCGDGYCEGTETQSNCCDDCGCLTGYSCVNNACVEEQDQEDVCSDGTPYWECSVTKPKYCNGGDLDDMCSTCGCPGGYYCDANVCVEIEEGEGSLPDLTVSELSYTPSNPTTETDIDIVTVKICNIGSVAAVPSGGSWSYDFLEIIYDGPFPDFFYFRDTVSFGTLNPGACEIIEVGFSSEWFGDITETGTATLTATVDPVGEYTENEVLESDESNNAKTVQVTISS